MLGPTHFGYTNKTLDCIPPMEENTASVDTVAESGIIFQQSCTNQASTES